MRKLFILLLLIVGWALIFYPLVAGGGAPVPASGAHPAAGPLPGAWQGSPRLWLGRPSGADGALASGEDASCGSRYTLVSGDTLGSVAQRCGLTLKELLAANPGIADPNHVSAGLELDLPDPRVGRGGGDTLADGSAVTVSVAPGGYAPGASVQVQAAGLPPGAAARIGLGLASSGYRVLAEGVVDSQGHLVVTVTLPLDSPPGDSAFLMLTTQGVPAVQRMSASFTISTP